MKNLILILFLFALHSTVVAAKEYWTIGTRNHSGAELALGPAGYKQFLAHDFGYEDRYYLIGKSRPATDFPYVLPGPVDSWGGTGGT